MLENLPAAVLQREEGGKKKKKGAAHSLFGKAGKGGREERERVESSLVVGYNWREGRKEGGGRGRDSDSGCSVSFSFLLFFFFNEMLSVLGMPNETCGERRRQVQEGGVLFFFFCLKCRWVVQDVQKKKKVCTTYLKSKNGKCSKMCADFSLDMVFLFFCLFVKTCDIRIN